MDYTSQFDLIREDLESGDPRSLELGLIAFTEDFKQFLQSEAGGANASVDRTDVRALSDNCNDYACINAAAVANAGAFVNALVYANVAGATLAVAAVAVVFIVGPVAYLGDPDSPHSKMTDFERDIIIDEMTSTLAR